MTATRLGSASRVLLFAITGFALGAALFAAVALPATVAYQPLVTFDEHCYMQSLDDILEHRLDRPATGCVPRVVFVTVIAARYGPGMFLMPLGDIDIRAPIASALLFAVIGAFATASAGPRRGTVITVTALLVVEFALAVLLLILWALG